MKSEISGAIYPVPYRFSDRFFDGKKKTFVKCLPRNKTRLEPKQKIVFYGSYSSKKLFGEGTIETVEFLEPNEILNKYRDNLFLTEPEFLSYVAGRNRKLLTICLTKLVRYKTPISFHRPVTMTGQYLTPQEYSSLMSK